MNKNIYISVQGVQDTGGGIETILTRTMGTYYFESGFHVISYRELDEHGTATDNILFLSETEMRLNKSGSLAGQFHFLSGKRTFAEYQGFYGGGRFFRQIREAGKGCGASLSGAGAERSD